MLIGAISGFVASFLLTIDKIKILKDSQFNPSCNINEVLNCKSVMLSKQAEVFGFPNSLIGIAAFAIFIAVAIALLGGVEFPGWFLNVALGGTILGVLFSHWLAYQTTFVIGALCPYCMVAWFGNFLILSSLIQAKHQARPTNLQVEGDTSIVQRINTFIPIFHIVWLSLVIGAAYFSVS
ncbi:MAG: vitamin K epoxide reductase family protein [Actinomycetota bacterium]